MSGALNYAKAKANAKARVYGERAEPGHYPSSLRGWRTEWDGDPFPVTVTQMATVSTMPLRTKPEPPAETLRRAS